MNAAGVVIVGAGHAGVQAAAALRTDGFEGRITLLDEQEGLPYQRPPLSKEYLKGSDVDHRVALRPAAFFAKNQIDLRCGPQARVTGIDTQARKLELGSGEAIAYDELVLATGSRNRLLPVPGADLPSVFMLRTHDEAVALKGRLAGASAVAVVGGGFVGLEIAASSRTLGLDVTVIESLPSLMARSLTATTATYMAALHRVEGVDLRLASTVESIAERDGRTVVTTTSGDDVIVDLVVVGIGAVAVTDLADMAGLEVSNGIVVDECNRSSDPFIYAIGDCANLQQTNGDRMRLESVQSAVEHAKAVARSICSLPPTPHEVPWFWSNQHSAKLQIVGLLGDRDSEHVIGDPEAGAFSVVCFANERFIGGESVNSPRDHLAMRKILDRGLELRPSDLSDPNVDLVAIASSG